MRLFVGQTISYKGPSILAAGEVVVHRSRATHLALMVILAASCGDDTAGTKEVTVLGAQINPAVVVPGEMFTLTFPAGTSTGIDVVLRQEGEPIYVLRRGNDSTEPEAVEVIDGKVITRPALALPNLEGEIVSAYRLPEGVTGDLDLCDAEDEVCDPLPVHG